MGMTKQNVASGSGSGGDNSSIDTKSDLYPAVEVHTHNFFPQTPDLKGAFDNPRQAAALAQPKRKPLALPTDDGTRIGEKKAKKVAGRNNGVSTELGLLFDPHKIKKKLPRSDLDHLSRLLIPKAGVESHLFPCMSEELVERVKTKEGAKVVVWDEDTRSEHQLVFACWEPESYVLKGAWKKEFVCRRGLAEGDEIGIYWNPIASKFVFSLLRKA